MPSWKKAYQAFCFALSRFYYVRSKQLLVLSGNFVNTSSSKEELSTLYGKPGDEAKTGLTALELRNGLHLHPKRMRSLKPSPMVTRLAILQLLL